MYSYTSITTKPQICGRWLATSTLNKDKAEMEKRVVSLKRNMDVNQVSNFYTTFLCLCLFRQELNKYWDAAAAAAKSLQLCPTLCDPIDGSPPGSPVPGIFQVRTLEWVTISFSNAWKWKVKVKLLSRIRLLVTPWTSTYQAPPSLGFSRQEYWSGLPSKQQTK